MSNPMTRLFIDLNKYSFNNKNISNIIANIPILHCSDKINKKKVQEQKQKKPKYKEFFFPKEKDGLFWCWFVFKNGLSEYELLPHKYFVIEKTKKINFVERLRKAKFDKKFKIKKKEVELNLANDITLNIKSLEAMLLLENFNFIFMNDKIYYENIEHPGQKTCTVWYNEKSQKFGFLLDDDILFHEKEKRFVVDDYLKPVKSISAYKAKELQDVCKKIGINIMKTPTKCKTKKDLYSLLLQKVM